MSLLAELAKEFGLNEEDLERIIHTAPKRYKIFGIEKRHGGIRVIAQPSRELKAIQRYLVETKLKALPIHQSATGYVSGMNILQNAQLHRQNRVIMKLDFKDFFPSIKVKDWRYFVKNKKEPNIFSQDVELYSKIFFWGIKSIDPISLSIGAPSSPILSNILMYDLDVLLNAASTETRLVYSRYADDITVSGNNTEDIYEFEKLARRIIKNSKSPKLVFNDEKRGVYRRGQRRMVTGLVITPNEKISLGRERKRLISSMLHHVAVGRSDTDAMGHLKGLLGFCLANEPEFVDRMREKYGSQILDQVLKFRVPLKRTISPTR